jgi:hypothetical protein
MGSSIISTGFERIAFAISAMLSLLKDCLQGESEDHFLPISFNIFRLLVHLSDIDAPKF